MANDSEEYSSVSPPTSPIRLTSNITDDFPLPTMSAASKNKLKKNNTFQIDYKMINHRKAEIQETEFKCSPENIARTEAFNQLANKDNQTVRLTATKACRNVSTLTSTGGFGVCYRKECTFAHSQDELSHPQCTFDTSCRQLHGRTDRNTGFVDTKYKCRFKHSNESVHEFLYRTGTTVPNLPQTNVKSRVFPSKAISSVETSNSSEKKQSSHISDQPSVQNNSETKKAVDKVKRKNRWDEKPSLENMLEDMFDDVKTLKIQTSPTATPSATVIPTPVKPIDDSQSAITLRVPESMAQIALKIAFEQGHTNVTLIFT
jgi:hypothetical protein